MQGCKRWLLDPRKCTKGCREYKGYKRVQGIKGEQGTHGCNKVSRGCRQIWHSGHRKGVDTSGCKGYKRVQEEDCRGTRGGWKVVQGMQKEGEESITGALRCRKAHQGSLGHRGYWGVRVP